ncbi:DUF1453 family protein [Acidianus manzaensis]|uniref:DUF1453 domain-containing protein n=1 Tax=Acidianus manzaensis TaxID=282676 RepID=A0A1W6JYM1_9CREN|nr:DUF1453 family protein [Acidianus manzaensis]ARM75358.1 hypothetical protein B6F84_04475 [Acidianus manzaensis]
MINSTQLTDIYLAVFAVIIFLSSLRSIRGRKYKLGKLFLRPILYLLLGAFLAFSDLFLFPIYIFLLFLIFSIIFGVLIGLKLGKATVFYKNSELYYKRSLVTYIIWLILFLGRISIEILGSVNDLELVILDSMLMLSAGLLIGESYQVITFVRKMKKYEI